MELKEGYGIYKDDLVTHIYPTTGRAHWFDKCWCKPVVDNRGVIHHNFMKENNIKCEKEK